MKLSNILCVILIIAGILALAVELPLSAGYTTTNLATAIGGGLAVIAGIVIAAFNYKK